MSNRADRNNKWLLVPFIALVVLWAVLGHHYYTIISEYAGLGYYMSHPVLYVGVEFMWLTCVAVATWLCVKVIDFIREEGK